MGHQRNHASEIGLAFKSCRFTLSMVGFFSFFINLLMLSIPLYMLLVYDRVLTSGSHSTLLALTVLTAMMLIIMGALELFRSRILVRVGSRLERLLSGRVFDAFMRQSLRAKNDDGMRPLQDLTSVRDFLSGQGPLALFDAPWTPIYIGALYLLHPLYGFIATVGAVVLFTIALLNELITRHPTAEAADLLGRGRALAIAGHRNSDVLFAMNMLTGLRDRWQWYQANALARQSKASDRAGAISASSKTIRLALQAAILGAGATLVIDQLVSPGSMIAASIIMGRALAPVDQAIGNWRHFIAARSAFRRLDQLLHAIPAELRRMELPKCQGQLTVEKVIAGPPGAQKPTLTNISFDLAPGQALGVLGPSGSGKSTLVRLITGIWQAQHGNVRLGGATLAQWDSVQRGQDIGYLPQDVVLFSGTVRENISRFSEQPDDEAVARAASRAGVHEMILHLPDGYETQIGDGGNMLSGGQRQRVAFARALYGDPVLVVLDEPNSNLDAEGEAALAQAIREMKSRGQTVSTLR